MVAAAFAVAGQSATHADVGARAPLGARRRGGLADRPPALRQRGPPWLAAVLSWIWCESSLRNATREFGFREVALVAGPAPPAPGHADQGDGAGWQERPGDQLVRRRRARRSRLVGNAGDHLFRHPRGGPAWPSTCAPCATASAAVRLGAAAVGFLVCAAPWFAASFSDGFTTLQAPRPPSPTQLLSSIDCRPSSPTSCR